MINILKKLFFGKNNTNVDSPESPSSQRGVLTVIPYPDGREYIGEVDGTIPHGRGKMTFPTGNVYEGEFRNGAPNGEMKISLSNGDTYEGEMKDGLKCGKGKYVWASGEVYIGEWADDKRNGQGQLTTPSGIVYSRKKKNSYLTGYGTETHPDGYKFEGVFESSKKVKGKESLPSGDVYEGPFQDNMAHGYGKECLVDGSVYEGYFENGQYNGHGTLITNDGIKYEGTFINGFIQNDKESFTKTEGTEKPLPLTDVIVSTWKNLDAEIIAPYLSDTFRYNSAWISNTITGKDEYLSYLRKKFETIKKSGDCPSVDVIDENGFSFPHLKQIGTGSDSILAYWQVKGKINRMFMRPTIKLNIVPKEKWGDFAKAYQDNLYLSYQTAGKSIQEYVSENGQKLPEFSWLQTNLTNPAFQHLCFRYQTYIFSVIIGLHGFETKEGKQIDGIIVSEQDYSNLIRESNDNNLIPCICPIAARPLLPLIDKPCLIHALTGDYISLDNLLPQKQVPMSKWEINSMGVQTVMQYIEKENGKINSYCDVVGIEPQIWFERNGRTSYVIVRSIPVGYRKHKFEINHNLLLRLSEYDGYFADVQFASSSAILFDENGIRVPLGKRDGDEDVWMWRGDSFYCHFIGLQPIEKAIEDNDFIEVIDEPSYDIK